MNFWGRAATVFAYGIGAFVYFLFVSDFYKQHKAKSYNTPASLFAFAIEVTLTLGFFYWLFS
jgi:hypothetical protein